jgi:hypothetical protein
MTKKDYELIGKAIGDSMWYQSLGASPAQAKRVLAIVMDTATRLANKLATADPKFNKEKFLSGCNICVIKSNGRQNNNYDWICVTHHFSMSYISSEQPTTCGIDSKMVWHKAVKD